MTTAITTSEAAAHLGIRLPDIYDLLNERRLTYISGTLSIPLEEVESEVRRRKWGLSTVGHFDPVAFVGYKRDLPDAGLPDRLLQEARMAIGGMMRGERITGFGIVEVPLDPWRTLEDELPF